MNDGLDNDGHEYFDAEYDESKIYRFKAQDEHGHYERLSLRMPAWMMHAIDGVVAPNPPFSDRSTFVRDAIFHSLHRLRRTQPDMGGWRRLEVFGLVAHQQAEWDDQDRLIHEVDKAWKRDIEAAIKRTHAALAAFREDNWDVKPILQVVPTVYRDLFE